MGYVEEIRTLVGSRPLILAAAGVVVRDAEDRVLLHRSADNTWSIPGGALELGETFEQAARRELQEETGLTARELTLVCTYSGRDFFHRYADGNEAYIVGALFATREIAGAPIPDVDEAVELRFFAIEELPPTLNATSRLLLERYRLGSETVFDRG